MNLEVANLSIQYTGESEYALHKLSLECDLTGISAIVGASGVGKSTLLGVMAGVFIFGDPLIAEYTGSIRVNGRLPGQISGPRTIAWVPQHSPLLDHLSALDNVLLPLTIEDTRPINSLPARSLLAELGLRERQDKRPRELSGGMRARVSLARTLVTDPKYLYLDEPFVGLDLMHRWNIYSLVRQKRSGQERVTVITTHNIPEAMLLSDRIIAVAWSGKDTRATVIPNVAILPTTANIRDALQAARIAGADLEANLFAGPLHAT